MASAKTKAALVEQARSFLSSDLFRKEVVVTIPADIIYSFESAMEQVLVSDEGFETFKSQWIAVYKRFAKKYAKNELKLTWNNALEAAHRFVERQDCAGNDGQEIFDRQYRDQFGKIYEEMKKVSPLHIFETVALRMIDEINALIEKIDNAKVEIHNHNRPKKPGSAAKRGKGNRSGKSGKGGAKKRGVKGKKQR